MKDVIVFCPDTEALMTEVTEKFPDRVNLEDPENPIFLVDKTPPMRKGKETLALVRCRDGDRGEPATEAMLNELAEAGVIKVLGTWEETKNTTAMKKIYDGVHTRKPTTYGDENDEEHTTTPPEEIGRFA